MLEVYFLRLELNLSQTKKILNLRINSLKFKGFSEHPK